MTSGSKEAIITAIVIVLISVACIITLGTWRGEPQEYRDNRLAPPPGGFQDVDTLYDDSGEWRIQHLGVLNEQRQDGE